MVVDCLPKIAAEVAAPLEKVDDIVIVGGSGDGATQLLATLPVNKNRRPSKPDAPPKFPVATGIVNAGLKMAGGMIPQGILPNKTPSVPSGTGLERRSSNGGVKDLDSNAGLTKTPSDQSDTSPESGTSDPRFSTAV